MKTRLFLCIVILFLSACTKVETIEHVEVFMTITLEENEEGFSEENGYKKVNAITRIEESKNHLETEIRSVEDYYDGEGNYLETVIRHSTFEKNKVTLVEDGEDLKKKLQEPSTILIPEEATGEFQLKNMTDEEKEKVREHVLSLMEKLGE